MKKLVLLIGLIAGLVLPAATAQAATTIEKNIPFEATIDECGETILLSGTLIGIFTEQALPGGGFLVTFTSNRRASPVHQAAGLSTTPPA